MTIYADTSVIVATRAERDVFHEQAARFYEKHQDDIWLWSPWHRIQVFNTIRQLTRNPDRKRVIEPTEARAMIYRLEADVRCDYFLHMEPDWRDVLRAASEISVGNALERACAATDLLHVAYAVELASDLFVSFDDDQLELARFAGLKAEKPG